MDHARRPRAATSASPLPTLATLLAGGAVILGCQDIACGDSRATELEVHGRNASHELKDGNVTEALGEVGIALGVLPHRRAAVVTVPYAAPYAIPYAVPYNEPVPAPAGGISSVRPDPPSPPMVTPSVPSGPIEHSHVHGGLRRTTLQPTTPPGVPQAQSPVLGGLGAVTVLPSNRRTA